MRFARESIAGFTDWQDRTILIAEDTDINYYLLAEVLKKTKAKIIRVKDGSEALEFIKMNEIHLVLMDINMPNMDGYKATRLIKEYNPKIPVIIQTAIYEDGKDKAEQVGADDFISKPIHLKLFMEKISRFLN
jgi:two-component system, cell cycle response regulator DivK